MPWTKSRDGGGTPDALDSRRSAGYARGVLRRRDSYWAFGATLAVAAIPLVKFEAPAAAGALAGASIEYVYGIAIFMTLKPDTTS